MKSIRAIKDCSKAGKQLASTVISCEKDFFGIGDITSKDIAGSFKSLSRLPKEDINTKYKPLLNKRNQLENEVVESNAFFGSVRFDKDNLPKRHGQFESINERKLQDTIQVKQMYMPDDGEVANKVEDDKSQPEESGIDVSQIEGYRESYIIRDVLSDFPISDALKIFKDLKEAEKNLERYTNVPPLIFHFKNSVLDTTEEVKESSKYDYQSFEGKLSGANLSIDGQLEKSIAEAAKQIELKPPLLYKPEDDEVPFDDVDPESTEFLKRDIEMTKRLEWDESIEEEFPYVNEITNERQPPNALDYLKSLRAQKIQPQTKKLQKRYKEEDTLMKPLIELDSHGYRNYSKQVPDWNKFTRQEILRFLKRSIIYDNYGIVALNKPYGIASHETSTQREPIDINGLMQELAKDLRYEELYLTHRLDKNTTGVLIFASCIEKAKKLHKQFRADQIRKTYWCIVKGKPVPEAALIDIPIGEFIVGGKARSCVCPERLEKERQFSKRYREARRAVTEYQVLKSNNGASLVEIKPRTGVKHQIRCHMSFGVGTPILGDHKYNRFDKIVPQQLTVPILKALHLRQQKTRTLPIHLHAKSVVIPEAKANGETLFIKAPLPNHFTENMKSLNLSMK